MLMTLPLASRANDELVELFGADVVAKELICFLSGPTKGKDGLNSGCVSLLSLECGMLNSG